MLDLIQSIAVIVTIESNTEKRSLFWLLL